MNKKNQNIEIEYIPLHSVNEHLPVIEWGDEKPLFSCKHPQRVPLSLWRIIKSIFIRPKL